MGCVPTERALELFLAGDQNGRVARAPRSEFARDFAAGDALGRINHLQDGEAAAVADVEGFAGNTVNLLECADVRIRDVEHMDVIANTSSIGSGIVRAENIDVGQMAAGRVENPGEEMSRSEERRV